MPKDYKTTDHIVALLKVKGRVRKVDVPSSVVLTVVGTEDNHFLDVRWRGRKLDILPDDLLQHAEPV